LLGVRESIALSVKSFSGKTHLLKLTYSLTILGALCWLSEAAGGPPKAGDQAAEISGKDLNDQPMQLSDFKGKVVVLEFWGDWCADSRRMYDYNKSLLSRMKDQPFVLIGVNNDKMKASATAALKNHGLSDLRCWWNNDVKAIESFGVVKFPTYVIIDVDGTVRHVLVEPTADDVDKALGTVLPKSAVKKKQK
jgi:peroxiredoxin